MNGRVYDPRIGRFVQLDPFVPDPTFSQDYNRYAYVRNQPMSLTDPSGFNPIPNIAVTAQRIQVPRGMGLTGFDSAPLGATGSQHSEPGAADVASAVNAILADMGFDFDALLATLANLRDKSGDQEEGASSAEGDDQKGDARNDEVVDEIRVVGTRPDSQSLLPGS